MAVCIVGQSTKAVAVAKVTVVQSGGDSKRPPGTGCSSLVVPMTLAAVDEMGNRATTTGLGGEALKHPSSTPPRLFFKPDVAKLGRNY